MKRNETLLFGDVLRSVLRVQGLESPLNEMHLVDAWPEVVGSVAMRYTSNVFIKNQTLHVQLTSAVLRQELSMRKTVLVKQLNEKAGAQVITDIMFR